MLSCKIGVKSVNVLDYDEKELRSWSKKKILKCPVCNEIMIYKHGMVRTPHFAHEKDSECTYTFFENETKEHALGKVLIYKMLKKNLLISNIQLEGYIPSTKQRPDLYFEINNQKYVIEYQCTPILLNEFEERRKLYKLADIKDIWIFGSEKYRFTETGKLKMKVSEEYLFDSQQRIYYLNPFNEILYKFYKIYDFEYRFPVISVDIKNCEFDISGNEIMFGDFEYKKKERNKNFYINSKYKELQNYNFLITNDVKGIYIKNDVCFTDVCFPNLKDKIKPFNGIYLSEVEPIVIEKIYDKFKKIKYKNKNIYICVANYSLRLETVYNLLKNYSINATIIGGR